MIVNFDNEKHAPLIDKKLRDIEIHNLEDDSKQFMSCCKEIEKDLNENNLRNFQDREKFLKIGMKMENLQELSENIYTRIKFIQNSLSDNLPKSSNSEVLKKTALSVSSRYNDMFSRIGKIISSSKVRIDREIEINRKIYLSNEGHVEMQWKANSELNNEYNAELETHKLVTDKIRRDIDSMTERKDDMDKLLSISQQIHQYTKEIRQGFSRHGRMLSNVEEENMKDTPLSVSEANVGTESFPSEKSNWKFWLFVIISIFCAMCVVYVYLKLNFI